MDSTSRTALDMQITFQELTIAVGQLKPGRSPGIDGLTLFFVKVIKMAFYLLHVSVLY